MWFVCVVDLLLTSNPKGCLRYTSENPILNIWSQDLKILSVLKNQNQLDNNHNFHPKLKATNLFHCIVHFLIITTDCPMSSPKYVRKAFFTSKYGTDGQTDGWTDRQTTFGLLSLAPYFGDKAKNQSRSSNK